MCSGVNCYILIYSPYKARESAKRGTVLIDCSSTEEGSDSDNEDELEDREKDDEQ